MANVISGPSTVTKRFHSRRFPRHVVERRLGERAGRRQRHTVARLDEMIEAGSGDLADVAVPDVVQIERLVADIGQRVAEAQHCALLDDRGGVRAARVRSVVDHHRHVDRHRGRLGGDAQVGIDGQRGDPDRVGGQPGFA